MKVIPAIDLLGGKVVRLHKGERDRVTVYSEDPAGLVRQFARDGAQRVHVVDLDGAFSGTQPHSDTVANIARASPVPIQAGGGVRNEAALDAIFAAGAVYAVLGTAAVKQPEFVRQACAAHPGRIIVAVDARDGMVAVEGWVESAQVTAIDLGKRASVWGAAGLLYTDVNRDGTQIGPNIAATKALAAAVEIPVIASGGVSSLDDIHELASAGMDAVIVGRALYEREFTLQEALIAARGR